MNKITHHTNKGQGMTEYLIIVALIAISAVAVTSTAGQHLKVGFGKIAMALEGKTYDKTKPRGVEDTQVQTRDMGDFSTGVNSQSR